MSTIEFMATLNHLPVKPDSRGRDPALTDEWRCTWGRWSRSGSCKGRQHRAIVLYDCAGL